MPELAVPVLNIKLPLTPDVPALEVDKITTPLDVNDEYPLRTNTRPPLDDDDMPADKIISPPMPLFPLPTVTYIDPPLPDLADPDPRYKAPLLPELAVPVLNIIMPLMPDTPALDVRSTNVPLLDVVL